MTPATARSKRWVSGLRVAALPVVLIIASLIAWKLGYFELDRRQRLFETVQRLRVLPAIEVGFFFAYVVAVSLGLPSAVLTLLAGAIFGAWLGALLAWGASLLGTVVAHQLAHTIARKPITRLFGHHTLLRDLKDHDDVLTLFRLRVIPAAPFAVLAYVAGSAGASLRRLLLATAVGILPSVIAYSFVGKAVLAGMVSVDDASKRALWIAGGVTAFMLLLSLVLGKRLRGKRR